MKKTSMDLWVGGTILLGLFILIASILWLKEISVTSKQVEYTVLFPTISTLQLGDPVLVNGVKKGMASTIKLRKTRVAVVIQLENTVVLTDSSRITVQNVGLMGERAIGISLSEKGTVLPCTNQRTRDTTFINGYFDTGIAEAMGLLGVILTDAESLLTDVRGIVDNTVGDTVFQGRFKEIVARLDRISADAEQLVDRNTPAVNKSIDNLHAISGDIRTLISENKGNVNTIAANGADLTNELLVIGKRVDSLTMNLQDMVTRIKRGEGAVGMALSDEEFRQDIKKTIKDADTLITGAQKGGIPVKVKLW